VNLVDVPWEEKKRLLLSHKIALHDSIGYCHIYGSSDAKISNVQPSDLHTIFRNAKIEKVICNGAKAYQEYMRFFQEVKIPVVVVPSTSPANAKIGLDGLVAAWRKEMVDILELK
jgi:hypoxanthine-DNA glycosylase